MIPNDILYVLDIIGSGYGLMLNHHQAITWTNMTYHCWGPQGLISQMYGLEQERRNSIANALELRLSCTNPLKWFMSS